VPWSDRTWGWLAAAGLAAAVAVLAFVYPYLLDSALARQGVRGTAAGLLVLAGLWRLLAARVHRADPGIGRWPGVALAGVLAGAILTGERVFLLLVPAVVYLALAAFFHASLAEGDSIIERVVRRILPQAPEFIRSYCRKVTRVWVFFFAACALVIAGLAIVGPQSRWEFFTGAVVYALMIAFSTVEFFVRKTWFRYYFFGGPFDRLWSRLFPAENTPQGRRSAEYIRLNRDA